MRKIRFLRRAKVYSVPGASVERLIGEVVRGDVSVSHQKLILIAVGTNNLYRETPQQICDRMETLHDAIRYRNPYCQIVISGLIIRPQDEKNDIVFTVKGNPSLVKKRIETNDLLEIMIHRKGGAIMESWKILMVDDNANTLMYHTDGLHLSDMGIYRFTQYLINYIGQKLSKTNLKKY